LLAKKYGGNAKRQQILGKAKMSFVVNEILRKGSLSALKKKKQMSRGQGRVAPISSNPEYTPGGDGGNAEDEEIGLRLLQTTDLDENGDAASARDQSRANRMVATAPNKLVHTHSLSKLMRNVDVTDSGGSDAHSGMSPRNTRFLKTAQSLSNLHQGKSKRRSLQQVRSVNVIWRLLCCFAVCCVIVISVTVQSAPRQIEAALTAAGT
jgi:hypothetical protein